MNRFFILLTMLLMPLSALGQSTAVLDGIGLANGKSYTNYIKNPNARVNKANVTELSGSTITRVAGATALYQGTEFSIDDTNAWGAEWSAMALNPGLKNRLCEVQILAKSDAADVATLEVLQNSVAVFSQSITLDASNPKKFGGTFPCGDLTYTSSVKLSGTSNPGAVKVAAVYLGEPVSVSSGQITTEWQSYTPTANNLGAGSGTAAGKYRRVGDSAELEVTFSKDATPGSGAAAVWFSLPAGLTVDTAKIASGTNGHYGTAYTNDATAAASALSSLYQNSVGGIAIVCGTSSCTGASYTANSVWRFKIGVPISGWAATDIVTPEASLAEYVCTTGTWDADITNTSLYRGSDGCILGGALTDARSKTIGFSQAVKATDEIKLEFSTDRIKWVDGSHFNDNAGSAFLATYSSAASAGTSAGATIAPLAAATDVKVVFFRYALIANDDSPTGNWPNNVYWRVAKYPHGPGSQSFYLSSPLVAPPDGTGIKLKSSTNADLMTISEAGAAVIPGDIALTKKSDTVGVGHLFGGGSGGSSGYYTLRTPATGSNVFSIDVNTSLISPSWTNAASVTTTGSWTFGASSFAGTHTAYGSEFTLTRAGNTAININRTGASPQAWQLGLNDAGGTGAFYLYDTTGGKYVMYATPAGAWTLGASSGLTSPHTVQNSAAVGAQVLTVYKTGQAVNQNNNYYVQFNGSGPSAEGYIQTNGSGVLSLVDVSDERVKENISDATYGLHTTMKLRPVEFDWKNGGTTDRVKGFVAQEVKKILPESVSVKDESSQGGYADMHYLETQTMIPVLVKSIQEQQAQIVCLVEADTKKQKRDCLN